MMTTKGDMVGTGSVQDTFRSLTVKVLIKTFLLLPKIAIFYDT